MSNFQVQLSKIKENACNFKDHSDRKASDDATGNLHKSEENETSPK